MSGALTHSPVRIVAQLLIDLVVGTNPTANDSWPVYEFTEPDSPDSLITVFGYGGVKQSRNMNDGQVNERANINIRVRGLDDNTTYVKALDIGIALDESVRLTKVTVGSTDYLVTSASRLNGPLELGRTTTREGCVASTLNYSFAIKEL